MYDDHTIEQDRSLPVTWVQSAGLYGHQPLQVSFAERERQCFAINVARRDPPFVIVFRVLSAGKVIRDFCGCKISYGGEPWSDQYDFTRMSLTLQDSNSCLDRFDKPTLYLTVRGPLIDPSYSLQMLAAFGPKATEDLVA